MTVLSSLSWEAIFPYMNFAQRLSLSHRCPVVRLADKRAPLSKVARLQISPFEIQINKTIFLRLGVIRVYNDRNTPQFILQKNAEGGKRLDVDEYGYALDETDPEFSQDCEQYEELKKYIERNENRPKANMPPEVLKQISAMKARILPFELRNAELPPTYTHYLQLLILDSNGEIQEIERFRYQVRLQEAFDYLLKKIFKDKKTQIRHLSFQGNVQNEMEICLSLTPQRFQMESLQLNRITAHLFFARITKKLILPEIPSLVGFSHTRTHIRSGDFEVLLVMLQDVMVGEGFHVSIEVDRAPLTMYRLKRRQGVRVEGDGNVVIMPKNNGLEIRINLEYEEEAQSHALHCRVLAREDL